MQNSTRSTGIVRRLAPAIMLALLLGESARAQINGTILTTDNKTVQGQIRWMAAAKKYVILATRPGSATTIELELQPSQVARITVPQPKELGPAVQAVRAGSVVAAIPVLEKIIRDYAMLQWDEVAARALAEAQMANNNPAGAVKACEVVIANNPEAAYMGEMAIVYWQALLKSDRSAKLSGLLDEAIKKGGREASASALILRGDMLMDKKQPRDALKDGYLRVVVLYENVRAAQPEALFKAAKAFDALQQNPNAEKMRTLLRTKYPSSDFVKKL